MKDMNDDHIPLWQQLSNQFRAAGVNFKCNDNISQHLSEKELLQLQDEVTVAAEQMLRTLLIDVDNDPNTNGTAKRLAKMFIHETFSGRYYEQPEITSFPNNGYEGLYVTGPITIRSTCAHHFQNITGECWVGCLPPENVIGLSKFNRAVYHIAHRPQIQEDMTVQIADALQEHVGTEDIAVLVIGEHHCVTHRGVKEHESNFMTPILRGKFLEGEHLRTEFYKLIELQKAGKR